MTVISNIPDGLEVEILCRVSAKSLWELRTTCKRWYALFRDPWFVEKNKRLGNAARESMLLSKDALYSIAGDLQSSGFEKPIELRSKLRDLKGWKYLCLSHIFHCDGLMLCSAERFTRLVVWNPCTGQTRNIKPTTLYHCEDDYALGYSTCGHNYKILRRFYPQDDPKDWVAEYEIYELSSDSWRVADSLPPDNSMYFSGVSLKGDTYWVAEDKETPFFLIKFDFTADRFVRFHLPLQGFDPKDDAALSVVKDEKLSVLQINERSGVMRIWVSNKVDGDEEGKDFSWRSYLVLKLDFDKFHLSSVDSFLLDEENKVAVCCGSKNTGDGVRTSIYIVGEDMYAQVCEDTMKSYYFSFPAVLTYLPSLVLIQPKMHKRRRLSDT